MNPIDESYTTVCSLGSLKGVSKSVEVLFNGIEAVMVLTLMILKQRALCTECSERPYKKGFGLVEVSTLRRNLKLPVRTTSPFDASQKHTIDYEVLYGRYR